MMDYYLCWDKSLRCQQFQKHANDFAGGVTQAGDRAAKRLIRELREKNKYKPKGMDKVSRNIVFVRPRVR